jgi:hypothetical protein
LLADAVKYRFPDAAAWKNHRVLTRKKIMPCSTLARMPKQPIKTQRRLFFTNGFQLKQGFCNIPTLTER